MMTESNINKSYWKKESVNRNRFNFETLATSITALSLDKDNNTGYFPNPTFSTNRQHHRERRFSRIAADISAQSHLISTNSLNAESDFNFSSVFQNNNLLFPIQNNAGNFSFNQEQGQPGSFGALLLNNDFSVLPPQNTDNIPIFRSDPDEKVHSSLMFPLPEDEEKNLSQAFDDEEFFPFKASEPEISRTPLFANSFEFDQSPPDSFTRQMSYKQFDPSEPTTGLDNLAEIPGLLCSFNFSPVENYNIIKKEAASGGNSDDLFVHQQSLNFFRSILPAPVSTSLLRSPISKQQLKRRKDEAKYGGPATISLLRAQQTLNSSKTVSMAPSLENAPLLKLRKRTIDRNSVGVGQSNLATSHERLNLNRSNESFSSNVRNLEQRFDKSVPETITKVEVDGETFIPRHGWIGSYSPEKRMLLIESFLEKRKHRIWGKKIRYAVRKKFADSRLRVKGRFIAKEDEALLLEFCIIMC